MRQLLFHGPHQLAWADVAAPALGAPDDALVEPVAVATCDFDLAALDGSVPLPAPAAIGHEFVARVVAVGDDVAETRVGDLVMVPFQISCGDCEKCMRGHTANCRSVPRLSMYGFGALGGERWGGALSDLVRVPFANHMLVPVPSQLTVEQAACVLDNATDAWASVAAPLRDAPRADVLVIGGGARSMGIWAAEWALALGAGSATYVDTDPRRLTLAEAAGVRVVEGPPSRRVGDFEVTVDASGDPKGLACALRSTAPDGTCTSFGGYWEDTPIPIPEMYSKNATFRIGRVHSRGLHHEPLRLIAAGEFDPTRIASTAKWEDATTRLLYEDNVKLLITREHERS